MWLLIPRTMEMMLLSTRTMVEDGAKHMNNAYEVAKHMHNGKCDAKHKKNGK